MFVTLLLLGCIDTTVTSTAEREPDAAGEIDPHTHDADHDGTVDAEDCKPYDTNIHPKADDLCDGIDNDCDGKVDEGNYDLDDDGYDDVGLCFSLPGDWDCNDGDPAIHPGALEECDFIDQNCDGEVDNADYDGDGQQICDDCDDDDAFVFDGAAEACDGLDNDCDGEVDELWDFDGDGYSACESDCDDTDPDIGPDARDDCDGIDNDCDGLIDELDDVDGDGVATCEGDCDDHDAAVFPGATESCDGKDNDCDATTSENGDTDGDGFTICTADCDESSAAAHPGGTESCDSVDNDCNGYTDEMPECYGCTASSTYYLCSTPTSWDLAENACEAFGGQLARVGSGSENDDVANLAVRSAWIGANDRDVDLTYVWADGAALVYDSWAIGEPISSDAYDCAITNNAGRRGDWALDDCSSTHQFVCEF